MYKMQAVKMLIDAADVPLVLRALFPRLFGTKVNVNARNIDGLRAVDILQNRQQLNKEMMRQLQRLAGQMTSFFDGDTGFAGYLRGRISCFERWTIAYHREKLLVSNANRNAVLVVAILIATATYQAVLSPPGGLNPSISMSFNSTGIFSGGGTGRCANATASPTTNPNHINLEGNLLEEKPSFRALLFWTAFITLNTIAFLMSIMKMITLLPNGLFFVAPLTMPLLSCYALSVIYISPTSRSLLPALFAMPVGFFVIKRAIEMLIFRKRRLQVKQLLMKQHQELQKEFQYGS